MTLFVLTVTAALAGYGDVDDEGYPSWADRELHLYTNVARVDPEAFAAEYEAAGCSYYDDFTSSEQTPHAPLYYSSTLNEAAVYHTNDMKDTGNFSHTSSDGTSFAERVARFYSESGYIGENIAAGYGSSWSAMFSGWMCSSGHRSNIMGDYNELGTGVVGTYYTQDFGAGTEDSDGPVAMGVHTPQQPTSDVTFYADWQDDDPPTAFDVVQDGDRVPLELLWGTDDQGVYAAESTVDPTVCVQYYFEWTTDSGETGKFPEEGSYLIGSDCEEEVDWVGEQHAAGGSGTRDVDDMLSDIRLIGCATTPGPTGGALALGLVGLAALGRRRR